MKSTSPKKLKPMTGLAIASATQAKVQLPPTFSTRVNQMAHRNGKAHADMWRASTMGALNDMASDGATLDELSNALAAIEADPLGVLAEGNRQRLGELK